jgi:hypothetical protein
MYLTVIGNKFRGSKIYGSGLLILIFVAYSAILGGNGTVTAFRGKFSDNIGWWIRCLLITQ